jgi:bacteriocin-like protein
MKREIEFQELNDEQLDQVNGGWQKHGGWHGWGRRSTNIDVNINVQTVFVLGNHNNVNVLQFSNQRA